MADRVVLHIGTMKSGTTYLQRVLSSGVLEGADSPAYYAGEMFGVQTAAVKGVLGSTNAKQRRTWQSFTDSVRERPGTAVVSQEFLSFARKPRAAEIVESFEGLPVEVVLTVRDQHGAMPAQWQSFVRNRGADDWPTYVRRLVETPLNRRGKERAVRGFRRSQDVPAIVDRWNAHPGVSAFTVVGVPPSGSEPTLLWRRFCEALRLDLDDPPAAAGGKANESLGYASCEAIRRVNNAFPDLESRPFRHARRVLLDAMLPLRPVEGRPELDRAGAELARRLNAAIVDVVRSRDDVRLVGAVEEFPLETPGTPPDSVPDADESEVRRALEAAWSAWLPDAPPPSETEALVAALADDVLARANEDGRGA